MAVIISIDATASTDAKTGFDRIAEEYDRQFTETVIGRAQRSLVHEALRGHFREGHRVLEINCGTGEDAIYLGRQGISVLACDASPSMVAVAREKLERCGEELPVTFAACANEALHRLPDAGPFDGVLSNFGGLNCSADLAGVAQALAGYVRPGGELWLCLIGRVCLWEIFWYATCGQWRKAFRRLKRGGTEARIGGKEIRVYYPTVREMRAAFSPAFRLVEWRGIGVSVPPSWLEPAFHEYPAAIRALAGIDRWIGRMPVFRSAADHVLFRLVREAA